MIETNEQHLTKSIHHSDHRETNGYWENFKILHLFIILKVNPTALDPLPELHINTLRE